MLKKGRELACKCRLYIYRALVMVAFTALLMNEKFMRFMDKFSITGIGQLDRFLFQFFDIRNLFLLASFLILGRYFCAWLCPLGLLSDIFERVFGGIRRRILKWNIRIPYKLDTALFFLPFVFTPLLAGYFMSGNNVVTAAFALVCLLSMVLIHGRIPCKYLCMAGSVPGLLSALSPFGTARDISRCDGCGTCSDRCSMAIDKRGNRFYRNMYCVRCLECMALCRNKARQWRFGMKRSFGKEKGGYTGDT